MVGCQERHEQILKLQSLLGSNVAAESVRLLKEFQYDNLESTRGMMRLIYETQLKVQLPIVRECTNVFQKKGIDTSKYTITLAHRLSLDVDDPVAVALAYREKMFSYKPPFSCMDNSKRIDDSSENYSLFEVNYNGMFHELPLRYEYGKVLPLKLSNSKRTSYSQMLDMIVYKLECEIQGLFYCIPRNSLEIGLTIVEGNPDIKKMYDMAEIRLINLYIAHVPKNLAAYYFRNLSFDDYHEDIDSKLKSHEKLKMDAASMTFDEVVAWEKEESLSPLLRTPPLKLRRIGIEFLVKNLYANFLHDDCVDDHFDPLDYWKYEDVYGGGCFDVGGSFKGFDWIDEPVGFDDRSLPGKSKDEFLNEVILDDVVSSTTTTLSLLLKRKGKSRVKFTIMRAIIKRSKMFSLRKSVRSNYGRFVTVIGLNEDVGDVDL
ncbi:hypothetical protein Tco_1384662 [Tanacetum coccineum]